MIQVHEFKRDETGATSVWSLFWTVGFLMIGGTAVDFSNVIRSETHLKVASESAVLAAVVDLPDMDAATQTLKDYVDLNAPEGTFGNVLDPDNFVFGEYDHETDVFTPGAAKPNAIQARLDRNQELNSSVPTYLLKLAGFSSWQIGAQSMAVSYPYEDRCPDGGLFSDQSTSMGSHNTFSESTCVYGANGVGIGSDNSFSEDSRIRMKSLDAFSSGNHNVGVDDALIEGKTAVLLPHGIDRLIEEIENGTAVLPHFITEAIDTVNKFPKNPVPGTFYIVRQNINLNSDTDLSNIGILALKKFHMANGGSIDNAMIVSAGTVSFGSGAEVGASGYCDDGYFNAYIMAKGNVSFGAGASFEGAQIVTQGSLSFSAQTAAVSGMHAEALGTINMGSQNSVSGCGNDEGLRSEVFSPPPSYALVR